MQSVTASSAYLYCQGQGYAYFVKRRLGNIDIAYKYEVANGLSIDIFRFDIDLYYKVQLDWNGFSSNIWAFLLLFVIE